MPGPPSWSAASASTSSARRCSPTAPTSSRRAGSRRSSRADELWCQLFSEPGAGQRPRRRSSTRAERVDGGWVLNGQKVWTSLRAVRRLGPVPRPHRPRRRRSSQGITCFVVDMRAPRRRGAAARADHRRGRVQRGVPRRRVRARRPASSGASTTAGACRRSTLTHERGTNPRQLVIHAQHLEELLRLALERGALRRPPHCSQRLAEAYVEVRLFQLHNWRSLSRLAARPAARARGQRRSSCTGAR